MCLSLLAPWSSAWPIGIILGLWGLAGLVYQVFVILKQRRIDFAWPDWLDWTLFSVAPALGNASMIAGAAGLITEKPFAPCAIAGAITLLLFAGVFDAWDLTLWLSRNRDQTISDVTTNGTVGRKFSPTGGERQGNRLAVSREWRITRGLRQACWFSANSCFWHA